MQVKVLDGDQRPVSRQLPAWFMEHIDRVAMRDGLHGSDAYLEQLEGEWAPVRRHWEETGELG
jgi:hypothetical protein